MGRMGRALGALLLVGGISTGLGGCNKVNKGDYDAVMRENTELRDKLATEQQSRQEADTRAAALEQQTRDYAAVMDKARATPGGTGRTAKGGGGDTGFGSDDPGVTSYRRGGDVVVELLYGGTRSESELRALFEPFGSRESAETGRPATLALYVVRRLVEAHGGRAAAGLQDDEVCVRISLRALRPTADLPVGTPV